MVNLVILAVMIVVWAQTPVSHVGIQASGIPGAERVVMSASTAPGNTPGSALRDGAERDAGAVVQVDRLGIGAGYSVCTLGELPVHGAPGDQFPVLYTLHYGDEVGIHERHPVKPDWVMIGRAEWVWLGGLCRE